MNAVVDVDRKSATDVAVGLGRAQARSPTDCRRAAARSSSAAPNFTESHDPGQHLRRRAQGRRLRRHRAGGRQPRPLPQGARGRPRSRPSPSTWPPSPRRSTRRSTARTRRRSPAATSTRRWPRPSRWPQKQRLTFGTPSKATDQNAFAVTKAFADKLERDDALRAGRAPAARLAGPRRPAPSARPGRSASRAWRRPTG